MACRLGVGGGGGGQSTAELLLLMGIFTPPLNLPISGGPSNIPRLVELRVRSHQTGHTSTFIYELLHVTGTCVCVGGGRF